MKDMVEKNKKIKKIKQKIALFIGRFQPFHKGHYRALKEILKRYKKAVIAIGSSNQKRDFKNPFLAKERKEMIKKVIEKKLKKYKKDISFSDISDCEDDLEWIGKIKKRFPPSKYDICSKNLLVLKLAKLKNFKIFEPKLFKREKYRGEKIRKILFKKFEIKKIKQLVPFEIYRYIKQNLNKIKKIKLAALY
ncbi:MAG: adenylyltransferase/cytidyltransferase family protein [Candidatus Anstonellaceae archaeon]